MKIKLKRGIIYKGQVYKAGEEIESDEFEQSDVTQDTGNDVEELPPLEDIPLRKGRKHV